MTSVLPLFDSQPSFDRLRLAGNLRRLANDGIFIGTSSWKYEGWLDQIYTRERYMSRGRFSQKRFEAECLNEYAEVFPIVCGDFSFYQFPAPEFWKKLFGSAPRSLRFAFKVPEEITVKSFPTHPRYGPRAGMLNESFLNADIFQAAFLDLLAPYQQQVSVIIFEFGAFSRKSYSQPELFFQDLDRFLGQLPGAYRYAVEIRNPEFLGPDYFACLQAHSVAHVFNAWTKMPELGSQIVTPGAFTTDFTVTRALLRQGRPYEDAVAKFSPYQSVQEENPAARDALRAIIAKSVKEKRTGFIFVNNRLEGNAPGTIEAVIGE